MKAKRTHISGEPHGLRQPVISEFLQNVGDVNGRGKAIGRSVDFIANLSRKRFPKYCVSFVDCQSSAIKDWEPPRIGDIFVS